MTPLKLWHEICMRWLCNRTECEVCKDTLGYDACKLDEDEATEKEDFINRVVELIKAVSEKLEKCEDISDEEFATIFEEEASKWTT